MSFKYNYNNFTKNKDIIKNANKSVDKYKNRYNL